MRSKTSSPQPTPSVLKQTPKERRATDRLYKAVQEYIEVHGGKLVIVGGVQLQEWPEDPAMVFRIAIKCVGQKPIFKEAK